MKKLWMLCLLSAPLMAVNVRAEESVGEKVEDGVEKVKDETCKMVNGKMECMAKKVKRKVKKAAKKVEDKAEDAKDAIKKD